jgi:acetyltransferase-like isoleucine patch superfamily enzyme
MADRRGPVNEAPHRLLHDVELGEGVRIQSFVNLYGCTIGDETFVGPFVEIQRDVSIGRKCRIQSHTFICSGVEIGDEVFVGHGVTFVNDKHPRATNADGVRQTDDEWDLLPVIVARRASIGSGALILGGVTIGEGAVVGAGAVVTRDVDSGAIAVGVPARLRSRGERG